MGNLFFACLFVFPTFLTMEQGVGGTSLGFFSPISYHCLCALTNPAFYTDLSLSLEAPSHLYLQIIPKVFFSKESQSSSDWLPCLARMCASLCPDAPHEGRCFSFPDQRLCDPGGQAFFTFIFTTPSLSMACNKEAVSQ